MELFKKIYYPKEHRTGKLIILPILLIILLLMAFELISSGSEDIQTKLIMGVAFLVCISCDIILLFVTMNPVLAFSPDSMYIYKHRILYGEIEKIQISKSRKIILFSLRQEKHNAWIIDCEQIFFDTQILRLLLIEDFKWRASHKDPRNIFLYNTLGFDTPLEEILSCFPTNIPIIEEKEEE